MITDGFVELGLFHILNGDYFFFCSLLLYIIESNLCLMLFVVFNFKSMDIFKRQIETNTTEKGSSIHPLKKWKRHSKWQHNK